MLLKVNDLSQGMNDCLFYLFDSDLQATANGIRQDFKIAVEKYQKYQQEKTNEIKPPPPVQKNSTVREKVPPVNPERPMRYPAEDIRFKNPPPTRNVAPIPVIQPLVSNAYEDDDDEEGDQSEENIPAPIIPPVDIEAPLLSVGEDFQALVSIAVNPSYFFVQNTSFTHDLERLAQSMK